MPLSTHDPLELRPPAPEEPVTPSATSGERGLRRATLIARAIADSQATQAGVRLMGRLLPPARVQLTSHEVVLARLPRHLDELRLLHLSDLHLHPGSELAWQVPDLLATVDYDLLCYTGDFINIDADIPAVAQLLDLLPRRAPAYAVLGNHDYTPFGRGVGTNDAGRLRATLTAAGVTVLSNQAHALYDGALAVVGVDDPATARDDAEGAMEGVGPGACAVMLAHSPDVVLRLGRRRPDLVLAGHTHGGQIRLPRVGPLLTLSQLPRHLAMGLGVYQGVHLFVSRGIGYSGLNMRIGSPAEVTVLTLRSPAAPR